MAKSFRMIVLASLTLACISRADAADPSLGHWLTGNGLIAGQPATNGATFIAGQNIVSSPTAPALIDLAMPARGVITLAPGSDVSLSTRATQDGKGELVLTVNKGAAQVNLLNKGPYQDMLVYSAGMVVRVKGSLLVVAHTKTDTAYAQAIAAKMSVATVTVDSHGTETDGTETDVTNQFNVTFDPTTPGATPTSFHATQRYQVDGSTPIPSTPTPDQIQAAEKAAAEASLAPTAKSYVGGYTPISDPAWTHDQATGVSLATLAQTDPVSAVEALANISMTSSTDPTEEAMAQGAASDLTQTICAVDGKDGVAIAAALASANPACAGQAMQGALTGLAANTTNGVSPATLMNVMISAQPQPADASTITAMIEAAVQTEADIAAAAGPSSPAGQAALAAIQSMIAAAIEADPGQSSVISQAASSQANLIGGDLGTLVANMATAGANDASKNISNGTSGGGGGTVTLYSDSAAAAGSFDNLVSAFVGSLPPISLGTNPSTSNPFTGTTISPEK
jgi:hypothetical protein